MLDLKIIEEALEVSIGRMSKSPGAPELGNAIKYSVFPGGARIRPKLCLAVAKACGDEDEKISLASCVAIELIHCASLVHDDLPCFDNALIRRGKESTHVKFGQPLAVLAGDSLIVGAFEELAISSKSNTDKLSQLIRILTKSSGMPSGICSGQGWESEKTIDLSSYHRLKTSSLFVAASQMGAVSAGENPEKWLGLGTGIGEAFQIADDLRDSEGTEESIGKPVNQDISNNRPSAVIELGKDGARDKMRVILDEAIESIPACVGRDKLIEVVKKQSDMLMSAGVA